MKRTIAVLTLLLTLMTGCSESDPDVTSSTVSDTRPVTGQRISLSLYASTDNPLDDNNPMHYLWSCSGGLIDDAITGSYYTYWLAPETTGTCSVNCQITDDSNRSSTWNQELTVQPRSLSVISSATSFRAGLVAEPNLLIGGIYAATQAGNKIFYYSSGTASDTGFSLNAGYPDLITFAAQKTNYYYKIYDTVYAICYTGSGTGSSSYKIINLYLGDINTYNPPSTTTYDHITAVALHGSYLWIGTDHGIRTWSTSSLAEVTTYDTQIPNDGSVTVNKIVIKAGIAYVATTNGIYRLDGQATTPAFTQIAATAGQNIQTILVQETAANAYRIWTVNASNQVKYYNQTMDTDRAFTVTAATSINDLHGSSLSTSLCLDLAGRIWNGKYYLDNLNDTSWSEKATDDLGAVLALGNPTESIISQEGLLYLFEGTSLKVWGKQ